MSKFVKLRDGTLISVARIAAIEECSWDDDNTPTTYYVRVDGACQYKISAEEAKALMSKLEWTTV